MHSGVAESAPRRAIARRNIKYQRPDSGLDSSLLALISLLKFFNFLLLFLYFLSCVCLPALTVTMEYDTKTRSSTPTRLLRTID
jgi:hypothetical protein